MIQGISPQPWRETGQFLWVDAAWPTLTETPVFLPEMTSPPSALKPTRLPLAAVVPPALSQASEAGGIPAVLEPVHDLHQLPRAGLAPALNLPSDFPPFSLHFEYTAVLELKKNAFVSQQICPWCMC